jgi:hypothetical protein
MPAFGRIGEARLVLDEDGTTGATHLGGGGGALLDVGAGAGGGGAAGSRGGISELDGGRTSDSGTCINVKTRSPSLEERMKNTKPVSVNKIEKRIKPNRLIFPLKPERFKSRRTSGFTGTVATKSPAPERGPTETCPEAFSILPKSCGALKEAWSDRAVATSTIPWGRAAGSFCKHHRINATSSLGTSVRSVLISRGGESAIDSNLACSESPSKGSSSVSNLKRITPTDHISLKTVASFNRRHCSGAM